MANDVNQTIQDSRKAAMSFLDAAKAKADRRNNKETPVSAAKKLAKKVGEYGSEKLGSYARAKAANDFLRAGRIKEARKEESPIEVAHKVRTMSDEEFERALASGEITPEQLRKAGEYDYDVYMGDVWSETDLPETQAEPSYEEFIADPRKYGVTYSDEDAAGDPDANIYPTYWGRYKRTINKQK